MAHQEFVEILRQGTSTWNEWRQNHADGARLDLSGANLSGMTLSGANLSDVNLYEVLFNGTDLSEAKLREAVLSHSDFFRAELYKADLTGAILSNAGLAAAKLSYSKFCNADLTGANLYYANLSHADLTGANLSNADLTGADLTGADLTGSLLLGAKFGGSLFDGTILGHLNLQGAEGLESVKHRSPSDIGINTIYRSEGKIPELFLRGCGVPESFIVQIPALVAAMQPIQFYSCFISYSSTDQDFAERLHADLQSKGVRVWYAHHDMKIGARIRSTIDESIRIYDKLLLVISEDSVESQWVEQEVETALRKECQPGIGTVLFPVRLDDSVLEKHEGWPAFIKNTRHIGDFTRWKDHDSYRESFERLMRDLKAEPGGASGREGGP